MMLHNIRFSTTSPDPFLSVLSHVLRISLLSSLKSTGRKWRTYQFWYSMANVSWVPWCWVVSTGLTRGHWALWCHYCHFYRVLAVIIQFLFVKRSRSQSWWWVKGLQQPCPGLLEHFLVSWNFIYRFTMWEMDYLCNLCRVQVSTNNPLCYLTDHINIPKV